jgi:hypothetical protein
VKIKKIHPPRSFSGGGSFTGSDYFCVSGKKSLPTASKLHVADGDEAPEGVVALTN